MAQLTKVGSIQDKMTGEQACDILFTVRSVISSMSGTTMDGSSYTEAGSLLDTLKAKSAQVLDQEEHEDVKSLCRRTVLSYEASGSKRHSISQESRDAISKGLQDVNLNANP